MRDSNDIRLLERLELIEKLRVSGHQELIEILLDNDAYTKTNRLNRSYVCRRLGITQKQLALALRRCKELLNEKEDNGHSEI